MKNNQKMRSTAFFGLEKLMHHIRYIIAKLLKNCYNRHSFERTLQNFNKNHDKNSNSDREILITIIFTEATSHILIYN